MDEAVIFLLVEPTWTQVDQQVPIILYTFFRCFPMIAMMSDTTNFIIQITAAIIQMSERSTLYQLWIMRQIIITQTKVLKMSSM